MVVWIDLVVTIEVHCNFGESKLTTAAIFHKGASYKHFRPTIQAYRRLVYDTQNLRLSPEHALNMRNFQETCATEKLNRKVVVVVGLNDTSMAVLCRTGLIP